MESVNRYHPFGASAVYREDSEARSHTDDRAWAKRLLLGTSFGSRYCGPWDQLPSEKTAACPVLRVESASRCLLCAATSDSPCTLPKTSSVFTWQLHGHDDDKSNTNQQSWLPFVKHMFSRQHAQHFARISSFCPYSNSNALFTYYYYFQRG